MIVGILPKTHGQFKEMDLPHRETSRICMGTGFLGTVKKIRAQQILCHFALEACLAANHPLPTGKY
jgi:hypothetical protein